jgi:hypothetical protein
MTQFDPKLKAGSKGRIYNYIGKEVSSLLTDLEFKRKLETEVAPTKVSQIEVYVEKRYLGNAGVTITAAGITSTNASYNNQLRLAEVGSEGKPFPCMWSAQRAAKALLDKGTYMTVYVVVKSGYIETIGSPNLVQNGDRNANPAINEQPNIMVGSAAADLQAASLGQHGVMFLFEPHTEVINICKSYAIPIVNLTARTTEHRTAFLGVGEFKWLYGQAQGFKQVFFQSIGVVNLDLTFEAHKIMVNMWQTWDIKDFQRVVIKLSHWWEYDNATAIMSGDDWASEGRQRPMLNIDVVDHRRGRDLFVGLAAPALDFWSGYMYSGAYGLDTFMNVQHYRGNDWWSNDGVIMRVRTPILRNNSLQFNFKKLEYNNPRGINHWQWGAIQCYAESGNNLANITANRNNHFTINIEEAYTQIALGNAGNGIGMCGGMSDSSFTLNCKKMINTSAVNPCILPVTWGYGPEFGNQITYKGKYTAAGGAPVVDGSVRPWSPGTDAENTVAHDFHGEFIQKVAGQPVFKLGDALTSWNMLLKDATLLNDGVTEAITHNPTPMVVMIQNVKSAGPISPNITQLGDTIQVNSTFKRFIKN